jgi:O-antigen/teichoic acid export membrane protein
VEPILEQQSGLAGGARRILANAGWRALSDIGSKAITLLLYAVMARKLGAADFGVFSFALALVTLVATLANFGQDGILTREVARDRGLIHRYFWNTLVLKLALALPALGLTLAVGWAIGMDGTTRLVILFLGIAIVIEALIQTCFAAYQAFEQLSLMPAVVITQRVVTTIPAIVALYLGADVVAVAAIYAAGTLVAVWLAMTLLARRVAGPRLEIDVRSWWPLMRLAAPLGVAGVFLTVLLRVDTAMLAFYKSDAVVGNYSAAYRLFEASLVVGWSVTAAVYPVFSRLTRESDPPVSFVYERALKLVLAPMLPLAVGAFLLGGSLVRLVYGPGFGDAGSALAWLAPAIVLYPVAQISGALLVAQNRQVALAVVYGLIALENVLANLVLIPLFSFKGAAAGASLSQALLAVPLLVLALRTAGAIDVRRVVAGPLLAAIASAVGMYILRDHFAVAVIVGAIAFVAVLVSLERRFYPEDARAVTVFLRRRTAGKPSS